MIYKTTNKCRISNKKLEIIKDFGNLCLSHFKDKLSDAIPSAPLRIGFNKDSNLFQLAETVDRDLMYRKYWYRSGTNITMTNQLIDVVNTIPTWRKYQDNDLILDIGCNDGTLLKNIKSKKKLLKLV